MKWLTIIILGIMFANATFADDGMLETYRPNEVFSLPIHLTNITGEVIGASCFTTISFSNYTLKDIITMNEIGNGYYNATYNTSQIGTYFCKQNCTLGTEYTSGSCDFIIGGGNKVGALIAIVMIIIAIIIYYLYMVKNLNLESLNFKDQSELGVGGGIKLLFLIASFWIVLIPLNFAMYLTDIYISNPGISMTLTTLYMFSLAINTLISFYLLFFILKYMFDKLGGK